VDYKKLQEEIASRDKQDSEREVSPLRQAEDAIYLDTSEMNIEQVTEKILELVKEKQ
jgi:cytidylate kinase